MKIPANRVVSLVLSCCLAGQAANPVCAAALNDRGASLTAVPILLFEQEAFAERALWGLQALARRLSALCRKNVILLQPAGEAGIQGPLAMSDANIAGGHAAPEPEIRDSKIPNLIRPRLKSLLQRDHPGELVRVLTGEAPSLQKMQGTWILTVTLPAVQEEIKLHRGERGAEGEPETASRQITRLFRSYAPEEMARVEVRYHEPEWVAAYVLPILVAYHRKAQQEGRPLQVFIRTTIWPTDQHALPWLKEWAARQSGHPSVREVLTAPAWEKPLEAFFERYVLNAELQGFRRTLEDLRTKGDTAHSPITLRSLLRYMADHRLEIRSSEPDLATWKLQQRRKLAEEGEDDAMDGESVTSVREQLGRRLDREEQIARSMMAAFARQCEDWPARGALRVELTLNPPALMWPPANPEADVPFYEALRARIENRRLPPEMEDLRLLQSTAYEALLKVISTISPGLPPRSVIAFAASLARRWTIADLELYFRQPKEERSRVLGYWLTDRTTEEERARIPPGESIPDAELVVGASLMATSASIGEAFSQIEEVRGDRRARIHYLHDLMPVLEWTNPGIGRRVQRVLTTRFSRLTEGLDYDGRAGARTVLLVLGLPVRINGRLIAALKIKAGVYEPDWFQQPFRIDEHAHWVETVAREVDDGPPVEAFVDERGVVGEEAEPLNPTGGGLREKARHEAEVSLEAFVKGEPIGLPLAWVEFPDQLSPGGEPTGAVILGQPLPNRHRTTDFINDELTDPYNRWQEDRLDADEALSVAGRLEALFEEKGRVFGNFLRAGFLHTNFHAGNSSVTDEGIFIHDTEMTRRPRDLTPPQTFGYLVLSIARVLVAVDSLLRDPFLAAIGQGMPNAVLRGIWGLAVLPADLAGIRSDDVYSLLHLSKNSRRPVAEINHPFLRRAKELLRAVDGSA